MHVIGSSHYIISHVCHWQTFTNSIIMQIHVDFIRITHHMHLRGQYLSCFAEQKTVSLIFTANPDPFFRLFGFDIGTCIDRSGKFPKALPELKKGSKSDTFGFHYQVGLAAKYGSDSQWINVT